MTAFSPGQSPPPVSTITLFNDIDYFLSFLSFEKISNITYIYNKYCVKVRFFFEKGRNEWEKWSFGNRHFGIFLRVGPGEKKGETG
jgi:hypothetical protein